MCGWERVSFSKQGKLRNTAHNCYFPLGPHGGVALTPLSTHKEVLRGLVFQRSCAGGCIKFLTAVAMLCPGGIVFLSTSLLPLLLQCFYVLPLLLQCYLSYGWGEHCCFIRVECSTIPHSQHLGQLMENEDFYSFLHHSSAYAR